jgi:hypothetical protein
MVGDKKFPLGMMNGPLLLESQGPVVGAVYVTDRVVDPHPRVSRHSAMAQHCWSEQKAVSWTLVAVVEEAGPTDIAS